MILFSSVSFGGNRRPGGDGWDLSWLLAGVDREDLVVVTVHDLDLARSDRRLHLVAFPDSNRCLGFLNTYARTRANPTHPSHQLIPAFLESYITTAYSIYKRESQLNYLRLLRTAGTTAIISAFGYRALRQVPYVRRWCEGNNWAPLNDNVEKRNCALVCVVIVSGAIAV